MLFLRYFRFALSSVPLKNPCEACLKFCTANSENSPHWILHLCHQETSRMLALGFCKGVVSSHSAGHSDTSHQAVTLAGRDAEKEIPAILNRSGAINTCRITLCWPPLSPEAAVVFPSVFSRAFLAAGVRRLHATVSPPPCHTPGTKPVAAGLSPGRPSGL